MDVSQFLGGSLMTHSDLPQPQIIGTIAQIEQRLVGQGAQAEQKICVTFHEQPTKALGLNKTNLRRIAELFGTDSQAWIGKQLLLYRTATDYQGQRRLCVRVCGPQQPPAEPICDSSGNAVPFQPVAAPATAPVPQQQPVAAPQPQPQASQAPPWAGAENSPPSQS